MRSFYPDILLKHPFHEESVITLSTVLKNREEDLTNGITSMLFDMEAAGVYQAGAYFLKPDQMIFLKIVSDYGDGKPVSQDFVTSLMEAKMPEITPWLDNISHTVIMDKQIFTEEEDLYLNRLAQDLQCSVTMEYKLRQLFRYSKLANGSFMDSMEDFAAHAELPCKTKAEGKMYIEQLKTKLI